MRKELYEQVLIIQEHLDKTMYLVRHKISKKLYVMKYLPNTVDLSIYEQLTKHPHPHMANVIEYDKDEQYSYVVEEYVNGTTLEYEISTNRLTYADKVQIMLELFEVLEHLHELKPPVIHRDLKPSNIMLEDGHVKLIDFEIARNVVSNKNKDTQIMGSVGYAPPEQFGFAQSDQRSDIYALGKIIQELFTEKKAQIAYRLLIETCLKLNPKERFMSVKALHKEFLRCSKGKRARKLTWSQRFQSYQIVGLRNDSWWAKVLVFLYAAFALNAAWGAKYQESDNVFSLILLRACMFIILMMFVWVPTNSFHLLEFTPLHRSNKMIVRIFNGCLVWFMLSCFLLFATSLAAGAVNLLIK